jgi:hypothetical protein
LEGLEDDLVDLRMNRHEVAKSFIADCAIRFAAGNQIDDFKQ